MIDIVETKDIDKLLEMRMEVLDCVFEHPDPALMITLKEENRRYYQQQLSSGGHVACLAYSDGDLAGSGGVCIYSEMPSPDNPSGLCAYIMNMYVRPKYRHHGIATKTIEWLIAKAKAIGADKIYLEATETALPLYKELGFKEMINMLKYDK